MSVINVAALQTALQWQDPLANRQQLEAQMRQLDAVDLIVLPEMFTTGFSMASEEIAETAMGPSVQWMQQQAKQYGAAITGSIAVKDQGKYYNRMYWVEPDGSVQHYDKRHLFRMAGEHNHYSPGQPRVIIPWRGLRFCLQVCYDLRFPVFARNRGDYDALIYIANWPAARSHAWKTLLPARAVENLSFVIGVNRIGEDGNGHQYSGDSAIIDFKGEILASEEPFRPAALSAKLDMAALAAFREKFPASLDADRFVLG